MQSEVDRMVEEHKPQSAADEHTQNAGREHLRPIIPRKRKMAMLLQPRQKNEGDQERDNVQNPVPVNSKTKQGNGHCPCREEGEHGNSVQDRLAIV